MAGEPYCGHCKYSLKGLTDSSKCPECGMPLVEVLQRGPAFRAGRRYTSPTVVFGLPLLSIALGPSGDELRGRAKGIIAIGDIATGWLALGGIARGIIALGGMSIGIVSFGGMSLGLFAFGGWAAGGVATGGGAVGIIANGGGAAGFIARGGGAIGYYASGGGVNGKYVISPNRRDTEAVKVFQFLNGITGSPKLSSSPLGMLKLLAFAVGWSIAVTLAVAAIPALLLLSALAKQRKVAGDGF